MSISAVNSSQSGQSNSSTSTLSNLEATEEKLSAQIKTLQKDDSVKNAKQIQLLQQQLKEVETQIQQQKNQSKTSAKNESAAAKPNAQSAYSLQLGGQTVQAATESQNNINATETVDISA